jgi:hypothetical protein
MSEAKQAKTVAAGQLEPALEHAEKLTAPGAPKDPRDKWTRELMAKLEIIRDKVQKLGKSYEQILKELLSKNPQKLDKALKDLQKLKELLEKLGMKPSDYLEP